MSTVDQHIAAIDGNIRENITAQSKQRDLLSQNMLSQLRNLVEGVAVRLRSGSGDTVYDFRAIEDGLAWVKADGRLNFVTKFHALLQPSASHYTFDGDTSERLMLRYFEYMLRLRALVQERCGLHILGTLEEFPLDVDPALREYQEKIAAEVDRPGRATSARWDRFYIHKVRPFFTGGRVYYEVTFYRAVNRVNKAERVIGFTNIDIADNYSANLGLQACTIEVFGQRMPITLIRNWEVSIRPCELNHFAAITGNDAKTRTDSMEYRFVMRGLTDGSTLLDLVDAPDDRYAEIKARGTASIRKPAIFPAIDEARRVIRGKQHGHNILRYLLYRMRNDVLKPQMHWEPNSRLSNLYLDWGCIPFDDMPFCSKPKAHNPRYWDLVNSLDTTGRTHELLARHVQSNVESRGMLYTPLADLGGLGDVEDLIKTHNRALYAKHRPGRNLVLDMGHVFIQSYEDDTYEIVRRIQAQADEGVDGYSAAVEQWLESNVHPVDDEAKRSALATLFDRSRVALIYGAAGTGKSTMVDHIANYFSEKDKLFLANTHPAVENLNRRVNSQRSTFRTIASQKYRGGAYDLVVIDECSTVSNADLLAVLEGTQFKLLVLVGDVYQIEAIRFGNWFSLIRSYIPSASVFELTTPYRASDAALVTLWSKVRNLDEDITEAIARNGHSTALDSSLFNGHDPDEIILALNYDGLYGINNINRFLQAVNPNEAVHWGAATYKIGDPVLFADVDRFKPLMYNNLKGRLVNVARQAEVIEFDVLLDRPVTALDVEDYGELEWVAGSTVRFSVFDLNVSDEDVDSVTTTVPFGVAYAVSIHKAQGLEFDSVKIVITSANEDDITHNIFYTAITRARRALKIYWSPETQHAVISGLHRSDSGKDVSLLSARRGLKPVQRQGR